jgi:periplasmic protein TonB
MKVIITSMILLFLIGNSLHGQEKYDTIFFNNKWEKSTNKNYEYYRIPSKSPDGQYKFIDYWKSGQIQMTGNSSSADLKSRNGKFEWFYFNGNRKQEINYVNNEVTGKVKTFLQDGALDFEYIIILDSLDNAKEFYETVEPFYEHLKKVVKYPKKTIKNKIEGSVKFDFFIDLKGKICKIEILEGLDDETNASALKAMKSDYTWPIPKYKKEPVFVELRIPINFKLSNN